MSSEETASKSTLEAEETIKSTLEAEETFKSILEAEETTGANEVLSKVNEKIEDTSKEEELKNGEENKTFDLPS